jgi:hypothetical protein
MGGARTIAAGIALVILVSLLGACGSDGSSKASRQHKRATHARVVAAKRTQRAQRRQVARRRMQRQASKAAAQQRSQHARLLRVRRARAVSPAHALAAIRRSVRRLNAAFDAGVGRGIARSTALNYWVDAGVYDAAACAAFEADTGEGVVTETLVVHPETFRATPGWVDPAVGRMPLGRLYVVGIDEIQTLVPTGEQRTTSRDLHASVGRDGRARLFFRCA